MSGKGTSNLICALYISPCIMHNQSMVCMIWNIIHDCKIFNALQKWFGESKSRLKTCRSSFMSRTLWLEYHQTVQACRRHFFLNFKKTALFLKAESLITEDFTKFIGSATKIHCLCKGHGTNQLQVGVHSSGWRRFIGGSVSIPVETRDPGIHWRNRQSGKDDTGWCKVVTFCSSHNTESVVIEKSLNR